MISRQNFSGFLRHPLLILVVTAAITGLLVPYITQQWKNQSRKADVKVMIITDAGRSVASMLTASQFSEFGGQSRNQKDIDRIFQTWEVNHIVVSCRIRAYLLDQTIAADWDRFNEALRLMYAAGVKNARRKEYLAKVSEYLNANDVNWNALEAGYSNAAQLPEYNRAWFELKGAMLARYGQIAKRILDAESR